MENFFSQTGISLFSIFFFFGPILPLYRSICLGEEGVTGKGRVMLVVLNLGQLGFLPSYSVFNLKAGGQGSKQLHDFPFCTESRDRILILNE